MIARIWHGRTPAARSDEYFAFLQRSGIPDYAATPGHLETVVLRSIEGEVAHFVLVTLWDSVESIQGFAGEDLTKARYYPEDRDFLLEFEETVSHYQVLAIDRGTD
jgi:heme-degrading monooxygenase HmoA